MAKWIVTAKKADFSAIADKYGIDPVVARIIRNRDIIEDDDIEMFLRGDISNLHSPYLLYDIEKAAEVLIGKINSGVKIRIIGDYDVDGICSTYILYRGITACGGIVDTVIPHRVKDGYGLNENLVTEAKEAGIDTIITCDNGIAAYEQIKLAISYGMTVIVTDHHEVPFETEGNEKREILPPAAAVVDPKRLDCSYPYKGICGGVVAYKFIQVLTDKIHTECDSRNLLDNLLEFAAFATVGDVMELLDENRIIVKAGLRRMERSSNPGLRALIEVCGLSGKPLSAFHIGFVLGPCINATGRLDTAERALKLLMSSCIEDAIPIATELKNLNDARKDMTGDGVLRAMECVESEGMKNDSVLVIYLPDTHESLAGIIAGRIREKYNKPTFVLTDGEEGLLKGSGRSIDSYNMFEKMSEFRELYVKYGGHKLAAGLSLKKENLAEFRKCLNRNSNLTDEDFEAKIRIDVPMPMSYVSIPFTEGLSVLEPFGMGNPKPVFAQAKVSFVSGKILGKNANVGKYKVKDESGTEYEVIFFGDIENWHSFLDLEFGADSRENLYRGRQNDILVDIIYYPDINEYRGTRTLQFVMQDYKRANK